MIYKEQDVSKPHGVEQNIKLDILKMIHSAANPFDIIYHVAQYLEESSTEAGYSQHVLENMRAVYGIALHDKKLLQDEIHDTQERLKRLEAAEQNEEFTPEERKRINFASVLHRKTIAHLQELLERGEVYDLSGNLKN